MSQFQPPGHVLIGLALALSALSGLPAPSGRAHAQTNLETNAGIQFNFALPGARNLGFGGAFVALADDATASYSNPAGLTNLSVKEVSLEVRQWRYSHVFTDRGSLIAPGGLVDGTAHDEVAGLSFISYVYPKKSWALSFYRHELANFEANFDTHGATLAATRSRSPLGFPGELDGRLASLRNRMSLEVVDYGVAAARRLERHGLSLGAAVVYHDFSLRSTALRYLPDLADAPDFADPTQNTSLQTQQGEDRDWTLTAGFLWRFHHGRLALGGVYRQGPRFALEAVSEPNLQAGVSFPVNPVQASFNVPDVFGLGVAVQPSNALRVSLDYYRVTYSDLARGIVDIFNLEELLPTHDPELDAFQIDDAGEVHLGVEYSLRWLILRAGAWRDPDHTLRFEGENPGLRAIYRARSDETHFGFGVGIPRGRFQVDFAVDLSDRVRTGSLTSVFRLSP